MVEIEQERAYPYDRSERDGRIHVVTPEETMTAPAFGSVGVVLYVHDDPKTTVRDRSLSHPTGIRTGS